MPMFRLDQKPTLSKTRADAQDNLMATGAFSDASLWNNVSSFGSENVPGCTG